MQLGLKNILAFEQVTLTKIQTDKNMWGDVTNYCSSYFRTKTWKLTTIANLEIIAPESFDFPTLLSIGSNMVFSSSSSSSSSPPKSPSLDDDDVDESGMVGEAETMKKGQMVLLTVKSQYGFGEKGKPATGSEGPVPPNKNLEITLELVSWKTISEVTDDRKVIKKIVKEGEGYECLNEGAIVKLKLIGKLQDSTVFLKKGYNEREELFELKIDEEQVVEGLDRAVLTMKKGEVALLSIAPEYAFGSSESRHELVVVPANSTIYYHVELLSFEKEKESWDLNTEEKIVAASRKKKEGNVLFKVGKYARASKRYDKFIKYDTLLSEEEKKLAKALKVACNLNNATCKLKLEDYKQAEKLCTKVLEAQSKNVKALYRRAQAYIQLADLDLVEFDIKEALEIDPKNKDVKIEYKKLKEYNKKEANFYGNMFAKMKISERLRSFVEECDHMQVYVS
ncbi:hypothetical protein UlMin_019311 [Ulmus minor]